MKPFDKGWTLWVLFSFCSVTHSNAWADLREHYLGLNYAATGSNGVVTNDISNTSLEYQHQVDYLQMFPTQAAYKWYFDIAIAASYYELEDPVGNLGITGTSLTTADLKAANYTFELGYSRRQMVNSFIQWLLGARVGGFAVDTSKLSGQTNSAQNFQIESKTSLGLTISAFSGLTWDISENYTFNTLFQLRKHYLSEFTVRDTVSGAEFKYPDFTSIGFSVGFSRGF